ncbi:spore coat U domain-containing protein [Sodalis sp. RH21]|uniref:Csu type fimbrial protein n=1 Tax=unclassified Sodalis (in: enterobacteria) TaxID=2636512 RepID=UPI0039B5E676
MSSQRLFKVGAMSLLCLGSFAASQANAAGTATTSIAVTATVESACTISTTPLAFTAFTGTAVVNGEATLSVICSNAADYTIGLGAGSGTVAQRVMTGPAGATLNYGLYQEDTHTTPWGDTAGTTLAGTGNGAQQDITVYGQIAANQLTSSVGDYTDTVAVTITY